MTVKKSESQVIIDAVVSLAIAMMEDTATVIVMENSVIGLSPAIVFKNEAEERLAWVCVNQSLICPQIFLAMNDECECVDAPADGFEIGNHPQIFSPRFQCENQYDGVCGYNLNNSSFATSITEAAKMVVRWLIQGDRG